jgi:hypothetical protein
VTVACHMGCQQFGVTALVLGVSPEAHGRTLTNCLWRGTSLETAYVSGSYQLRITTRPGR